MTRKLKPARAAAKSGPRQLAGKYPPTGGSISPVIRCFRELFPQGTVSELAYRTGADVKHCEKCLRGTRELGAGFQQKLLQSDVGKQILIALMGEARPPWWIGFRRHLKLAELVKEQARTRDAIEAMQRELAQ